ncbi:TetR/AcrR family transcriptional regulator [Lacrimispora xylanolytica]|uniref:TetR/AcrR family transcriptional regulator n=1 Tax=Lacrimispora xylanolytica TaxID=29375 RepID=A0ABY7A8J8_9FIRM|nr:TetR/AcrR family transcriptional regulator [Lacrimispora xylanolytica]WAJ22628.1 TetR/AcrR family transcriptional regulator [Lacrimispora xylanolytica]
MDLRIQKTYMALTSTFFELLEEKRFEDITVNELCKRAMVRRATFYKHFGDKYEFFTFFIREIQEEFDREIADSPDINTPIDFYINIVHRVMRFMKEKDKLLQSLLKSDCLPALLRILSEQVEFDILQKLKTDAENGHKLIADPEVMAHFFTGAILETLQWWLTQKKPLPQERIEEQILSMMRAVYMSVNVG